MEPILTFKSNNRKRISTVTVWPDRIEFRTPSIWGKKRPDDAFEVIPARSITSVTVEKATIGRSKIVVVASGNTIDLEVTKGEAAGIREVLASLMMGGATPAPPAPPAAPASVAAELKNLAELRDAGVLTDAEFETQKARLLT